MKIGLACRYKFTIKKTKEVIDARSVVHSDLMLSVFEKVVIAAAEPPGKGTIDKPFQPSQIGHWYYLAKLDVDIPPTFILCGHRLIARWGTGALGLRNYCTDVTDFQKEVAEIVDKSNYHDFVAELGNVFKKQDQEMGIDPKLPSYTRKGLRVGDLDDRVAANICRQLLAGADIDCAKCPELASTLCALFVCEANRCKETFLISLMLLDLIETNTTYGKGGVKQYTWKSMLMYHPSDEIEPLIIGRGPGHKEQGKHPMAGENTVKLALDISNYKGDNMVRDRVVSIMSVWLGHYMAKNHSGYTFFIVAEKKWTGVKAEVCIENRGLLTYSQQALQARAQQLECLIGGTTLYYENLGGDQV